MLPLKEYSFRQFSSLFHYLILCTPLPCVCLIVLYALHCLVCTSRPILISTPLPYMHATALFVLRVPSLFARHCHQPGSGLYGKVSAG